MIRLVLTLALLTHVIGFAAEKTAAPDTLRVLTYNIHHGEGLDGKIDLERIAALIRDCRADLVALQEVDRGVTRTNKRDLPAELSKLTGMEPVFERNIVYQGGDYGNAILSRFPVKRKANTHYRMLRTGEQRGLLQAVVDIGGGREALFMVTHIDFRKDDAERLSNAEEMREVAAKAAAMPVILCGDFNDNPGSRTHEKMRTFLRDTWELVGKGEGLSYSAEKPVKRIDYIFVNDRVEPLSAQVLKSDASDHLPVLAELRLK